MEWRDLRIEATPHGPIVAHVDGKGYAAAIPYANEYRLLESSWRLSTAPFAMMKESPLVPEKWAERPYLYNDGRTPPHQRAAMVVDLLDAARDVTAAQAITIAFSTQVWHAERWQERIPMAAPDSPFAATLAGWNRRSDPDSRPALAFYLFKTALGSAGREAEPPSTLSDDAIRAALDAAEKRLTSEFPAGATFGSLFRVGRQGGSRTWPVGGGSLRDAGMATPRAVSFVKTGKEMVGVSGQTATQVVILTKPPQSFMVIPLGESDDPQSVHFEDQAEKLFSAGPRDYLGGTHSSSSRYFRTYREK